MRNKAVWLPKIRKSKRKTDDWMRRRGGDDLSALDQSRLVRCLAPLLQPWLGSGPLDRQVYPAGT